MDVHVDEVRSVCVEVVMAQSQHCVKVSSASITPLEDLPRDVSIGVLIKETIS